MTSYLKFDESLSASGKTKVVLVYSVGGVVLGTIKWFARWRCYCFYPEPGTIWSTGCMAEVSDKIRSLTHERERAGL